MHIHISISFFYSTLFFYRNQHPPPASSCRSTWIGRNKTGGFCHLHRVSPLTFRAEAVRSKHAKETFKQVWHPRLSEHSALHFPPLSSSPSSQSLAHSLLRGGGAPESSLGSIFFLSCGGGRLSKELRSPVLPTSMPWLHMSFFMQSMPRNFGSCETSALTNRINTFASPNKIYVSLLNVLTFHISPHHIILFVHGNIFRCLGVSST